MQIDDPRATHAPRQPDDIRREILAILSDSGISPAQGIEAMIERFFGQEVRRS